MQIYEITQRQDKEQLDEILPALGSMAAGALGRTAVGQAVKGAAGRVAQAVGGSKVGQAIGRAADTAKDVYQKAQAMTAQSGAAQNTDMLGSAMFKQWTNRVAQLTNAAASTAAGTLTKAEYDRNLQDFVAKNMLQKDISSLDTTSKSRVAAQLKAISMAKDDPAKLQQAFKDLAKATVVARVDPKKAAMVPAQQQQAAMNTQQARAAVDQFMKGGISTQQQSALTSFLQQTAGTPAVRSTGNPVTDALINKLGIQTR